MQACEGMFSVGAAHGRGVDKSLRVTCGKTYLPPGGWNVTGGGPQSHSLHPSRRDNLYRVELEPPTSTELRYQRVRRG